MDSDGSIRSAEGQFDSNLCRAGCVKGCPADLRLELWTLTVRFESPKAYSTQNLCRAGCVKGCLADSRVEFWILTARFESSKVDSIQIFADQEAR